MANIGDIAVNENDSIGLITGTWWPSGKLQYYGISLDTERNGKGWGSTDPKVIATPEEIEQWARDRHKEL